MIITSHTGITYHVEHNAQVKTCYCTRVSFYWACVECACVEHYPKCIALGKMSGGHYLPNRATAYVSVLEIPEFFAVK